MQMDYEGHLKSQSLEMETFLGPVMAMSEASAILDPKNWKKSRFLGTAPSNFARIKIITYGAVRKASAYIILCTWSI